MLLGNSGPGPWNNIAIRSISGESVESHARESQETLETFAYLPGFSGARHADQIILGARIPAGYRVEYDPQGSPSMVGLGSTGFFGNYVQKLTETPDSVVWMNNGLSFGTPTSTRQNGLRVGGNYYSAGWTHAEYIRSGRWLCSLQPMSATWNWRDMVTGDQSGLSIGLGGGSIGRRMFGQTYLGADFGVLMSNLAGAKRASGAAIPAASSIYAGPAALIILDPAAIQIGSVINLNSRGSVPNRGLFAAVWFPIF